MNWSKKENEASTKPPEITNPPIYTPFHSINRVSWKGDWRTRLGWLLLGAIGSLLITIISLGWFVSRPANPVSNSVAPTSRTDLIVQLEQDYLNREIANALKHNPVELLNTFHLKQVQLVFQNGELALVTVGLETLNRDFEFSVTNRLSVIQAKGAIRLDLVGDVHFKVFNLPVAVLNPIVEQVNTLVAGQINQQIGATGQNDLACLVCQKLDRRPVVQSLTTTPGWLTARFKIEFE